MILFLVGAKLLEKSYATTYNVFALLNKNRKYSERGRVGLIERKFDVRGVIVYSQS